MKILFLLRSLNVGGAERQLLTLVRELNTQGHETVVATFYSGSLDKEAVAAGSRLLNLGKSGRWAIGGFLIRLVRCIADERPDILHSYLTVPNILASLLKLRFPRQYVVWGIRSASQDYSAFDWLSRQSHKWERSLAHLPDRIIVNSRAAESLYRSLGYPYDRILTIPNGIDTTHFAPAPERGRLKRSEWGIPDDAPLIGMTARIDPRKGHATFLKAAAILTRAHSKARFACVGPGDPSTFQQMATDLGISDKIIWPGGQTDMASVYSAFDIATSASDTEGFPNAVAEAMACGRPCVVTDAGDSAWIVGEIGIVVPTRDPQALATAWSDMLRRSPADRANIGQAGRTRIETEFGVSALANKTIHALSVRTA